MAAADEICRVSIRTADHEVDVTLPARVPVAELLPAVLDLIGEDDYFAGSDPHLARLSGGVLDTAATLAQHAIRDGELLMLTAVADRPALVPHFDVSTAVLDTVSSLTQPSRPAADRRAEWIVVGWTAVVLLILLGRPLLDPNVARHAVIGALAALLAVIGAIALRRDRTRAAMLGALAATLAGLTAALASGGHPGLPGFLLAMSASSATSLLAWRLLDCAPLVFLPLAAAAMAAAAATVGAVAGWWSPAAAGPMLTIASLATLAASARLSVRSSGLSTAGLSPAALAVRTRAAHRRLTALTVTAAAAAALGAVVAAATAVRPVVSAGFIAVVGSALLLRGCRQDDPHRAATLMVSCGIAATSLVVLCAIASPTNTPWLCGGLLAVATGAVWFGQRTQWRMPPATRRMISVLDLAVSVALVPSAAAAAGAFATLPGIGQP